MSHAQAVLQQRGHRRAGPRCRVLPLADCPVRAAVASPIVDGDAVVGALVAYSREASAMLVRAVDEVARWVVRAG